MRFLTLLSSLVALSSCSLIVDLAAVRRTRDAGSSTPTLPTDAGFTRSDSGVVVVPLEDGGQEVIYEPCAEGRVSLACESLLHIEIDGGVLQGGAFGAAFNDDGLRVAYATSFTSGASEVTVQQVFADAGLGERWRREVPFGIVKSVALAAREHEWAVGWVEANFPWCYASSAPDAGTVFLFTKSNSIDVTVDGKGGVGLSVGGYDFYPHLGRSTFGCPTTLSLATPSLGPSVMGMVTQALFHSALDHGGMRFVSIGGIGDGAHLGIFAVDDDGGVRGTSMFDASYFFSGLSADVNEDGGTIVAIYGRQPMGDFPEMSVDQFSPSVTAPLNVAPTRVGITTGTWESTRCGPNCTAVSIATFDNGGRPARSMLFLDDAARVRTDSNDAGMFDVSCEATAWGGQVAWAAPGTFGSTEGRVLAAFRDETSIDLSLCRLPKFSK